MAHFKKAPVDSTPFGKNEYRFSTVGEKFDSYTVAASSVTAETIDGTQQKILQSGEVLAKITSGPESGKYGPFQTDATDGRQTIANIIGINDTFLPTQLLKHDENVAVMYEGTVVQAKCFMRNAAGARIPLDDTTAAALVAKKNVNITFRV